MPNEDEQTAAYVKAAQSQYPAPVVIRTLDLGADKMPTSMEGRREMNPFLGLRAFGCVWIDLNYFVFNCERSYAQV